MSRPLLISDCDDVILHFARHFGEWVAEAHGFTFTLEAGFADALKGPDGKPATRDQIWPLLDLFFDAEMQRQHLVAGAAEALKAIGAMADIVILTNIGEDYRANRIAQLEAFDIRHRVLTNQGGKGRPVAELVAELGPSVAVFVDDLAVHHESVAKHAPQVWRLQMIAEPKLAAVTGAAPFAHARIDDWAQAGAWIMARLDQGPAPVLEDAP